LTALGMVINSLTDGKVSFFWLQVNKHMYTIQIHIKKNHIFVFFVQYIHMGNT
jgi:hypothetical protein